ncbi:MAG: hypothetical protein HFF01_03190 [Erysipelotrichaceae bacterium]|nr:hypothetical protein [Erysipelotrichaceae bacterium]MCI9524037.1 hypothetical protein [Erysipelotrichaceae bacterium]
MKLIELINAMEVISKLYNCKKLNAVTAYRIGKNVKLIQAELDAYNESRKKLIEQYSDKDEHGNAIIKNDQYQFSKENQDKFISNMNEVHQEEIQTEFKKIKLDQLDKVELSPMELESIHFLIEAED